MDSSRPAGTESASGESAGTVDGREKARVTGVVETALYVEDLERSRDFYARLLGLEPMVDEERLCALEVPGGQVLLLFLRGASAEPAPTPGGTIPPHDGSGDLHLALGIEADAVDEWQDRLHAQGIELESRVEWPLGGTSLYFRDPDGHAVELVTPGCWPNY